MEVEVKQRTSELEGLRDKAVTIMNESSTRGAQIQPQLTELNQLWDQLTLKLKVGFI